VSITPGQNEISDHGDKHAEPNHFEFEFNAKSQALKFDVWFCDSQEAQFENCIEQDTHGCSDIHGGDIQEDFDGNLMPIYFLVLINL
jgi:hypothetical protein